MKRSFGAVFVAACVAFGGTTRADEQEAKAVIDKAIKATGGEEKLAGVKAATWKGQSRMTFNDNTNQFQTRVTVKGLDHFRSELDGEFNGNPMKGVTVLLNEIEGDAIANQKRTVYLQVVPMTLVPLKGKRFQVESAPEEKVSGKPAAVVKVKGPDGKDFKLCFDRESGLPVQLTATVVGFQKNEFDQVTTFGDYQDFGGIKKATKIESRRNGERYIEQQVTEFTTLESVEADACDEPK